ncbi:MAG TPA: bifunctional diaminohydroxyphosphoribosylaminopyrimidine deaminase/5-amino-6-(5-phosphoribosylamino)uracil reductase RibD [Thermoanaerobaculia bacterium]|nr:bifunctional diaminohydroxyphosphoribosylaminopyrimidine deaminase/5-amino-6-(5-phosphoribosylamino)uracil reductase RibD [Thermoanaerobaculia bacterium]
MTDDSILMRRALQLAAKGRYSTSPNPMVGALIERDGQVIAEGYHRRAGEPHAEVEAIRSVAGETAGGTLFVTLEPCSHQGRTGPCADVVIGSGITRVVVAMEDPNPLVSGKGIERMRTAGLDVVVGVLRDEASRLNERFFHAVTHDRPFLLLKAAMTLDGKLATVSRKSQWITGEMSRARSLDFREEYDAILIGSGTVVADDPQLTRRLGKNGSMVPWTRVVVDANGEVPSKARVLTDGHRTIVYTREMPGESASAAVEWIVAPSPAAGYLDLEWILKDLKRRGISSLIAEGGSLLHSSLIEQKLWQKMALFVAPMIVGGGNAPALFGGEGVAELSDAFSLRFDHIERLGPDLLIEAYPA